MCRDTFPSPPYLPRWPSRIPENVDLVSNGMPVTDNEQANADSPATTLALSARLVPAVKPATSLQPFPALDENPVRERKLTMPPPHPKQWLPNGNPAPCADWKQGRTVAEPLPGGRGRGSSPTIGHGNGVITWRFRDATNCKNVLLVRCFVSSCDIL